MSGLKTVSKKVMKFQLMIDSKKKLCHFSCLTFGSVLVSAVNLSSNYEYVVRLFSTLPKFMRFGKLNFLQVHVYLEYQNLLPILKGFLDPNFIFIIFLILMKPENKIYRLFLDHLENNKNNLILSHLSNTTKNYVLIVVKKR